MKFDFLGGHISRHFNNTGIHFPFYTSEFNFIIFNLHIDLDVMRPPGKGEAEASVLTPMP